MQTYKSVVIRAPSNPNDLFIYLFIYFQIFGETTVMMYCT
jgi:hypothetical protein